VNCASALDAGKPSRSEVSGTRPYAKETMTLQYLVRINKDPDSDWGASVPDLPGCVATGKTIDQALHRIEGPIALHIRGMREDGLTPPAPRQHVVTPKRTARDVGFFATIEVVASASGASRRAPHSGVLWALSTTV
jgi:predicted RNase H-like HicB family nuclease